jgi:ribonucleotide reductase beta subunit family protein with ferritin-like domain
LANKRLKEINVEPIFPNTKNPYKHLEMFAAIDDSTTSKTNSFEVTNIQYLDPSIFDGWHEMFDSYKTTKEYTFS